jgi:hypothetical protein
LASYTLYKLERNKKIKNSVGSRLEKTRHAGHKRHVDQLWPDKFRPYMYRKFG